MKSVQMLRPYNNLGEKPLQPSISRWESRRTRARLTLLADSAGQHSGMTDRVTPSSRDTMGTAELESLVAQHYERLLRVAVLICRERADGEDAVQLALERAWRHGADLRDPDRLPAWLRRIVVREAIRIEGRKRGLLARWFVAPREIAVVAQRSSDRDLELRQALDGLPPGHRAAIVLHHLEGYSVAETAEVLGVPLETARSRLRTARERLRDALRSSE